MPLIEEISSCDFGPDGDGGTADRDDEETSMMMTIVTGLADVLDRLVQHYRQSIHNQHDTAARPCDYEDTATQQQTLDSSEDAPPIMIQALVERLLRLVAQQHTEGGEMEHPDSGLFFSASSSNNQQHVLLEHLWGGYTTKIRPVLFHSSSGRPENGRTILQDTGVPVLVHYERLLLEILKLHPELCTGNTTWNTDAMETTLEVLLQDITSAQSVENNNNNDRNRTTLVVLSTLLKLLRRLLACTLQVDQSQSQEPTMAWCRCVTILLPLSSQQLVPTGPLAMNPEIARQLLDPSFWMDRQLLSGDQVGLWLPTNVLTIVGLDPKAAANPVAFTVPSSVRRLVDTILAKLIPAAATTTTTTNQQDERPTLTLLSPETVLAVTRTVRAHLFGRDRVVDREASGTVTRLHLGHEMPQPARGVDPALLMPLYQSQPSRLQATLAWLHYLGTPSAPAPAPATMLDAADIWDEVLPILYELISSTKDECVRWGAVSLFHLLQKHEDANFGKGGGNLPLAPLAVDNILSMLSNAVRICRIGATLAVLGLAQRKLLQRLWHDSRNQSNTSNNVVTSLSYEEVVLRRRRATLQWLSLLAKHNGHVTHDYLVWGLLVGGVAPLLYDHAFAGENADALELGRLGLTAVLPVLRGDCGFSDLDHDIVNDLYEQEVIFSGFHEGTTNASDNDCKSPQQRRQVMSLSVQIAALGAMSNLLIAAHPVMPRHAGKLLCELVAYLQRYSEHARIRPLAFETTARALVVTGNPGALVWQRIASGTELDDPKVSALLRSVEVLAEKYQ